MSSQIRLHACLQSLSPPYFWEQLWSYWAPSHKDPERLLFASSFKHVVHTLLYIFLIVFYSHCIYVITTSLHKKSSALRFTELSPVFNFHLLIVFVFAICNTSFGQPLVSISKNWLKLLKILDNSPRKHTLAFTIWYRSIQSMSDLWLDIHAAFNFCTPH